MSNLLGIKGLELRDTGMVQTEGVSKSKCEEIREFKDSYTRVGRKERSTVGEEEDKEEIHGVVSTAGKVNLWMAQRPSSRRPEPKQILSTSRARGVEKRLSDIHKHHIHQ